jgi:hypothetical protein
MTMAFAQLSVRTTTFMAQVRDGLASFRKRDQIMLACVVFSAGAIVFVLYKAFVPETVLTVFTHPLPVVIEWQGGTPGTRSITYRLNYCKEVEASSSVVRELLSVDGANIVSLYTSGYALPRGCHTVDIVEPMPGYIPAGRYYMRITFTYQRNFITNPYSFVTHPFTLTQ